MLLVANRGIQQQARRFLKQRPPLMIRHAFQHLKLHPLYRARFAHQRQCIRHVEQIMRSDAELHRRQILRAHPLVQHALVVRIRVQLAVIRSLRPAFHRRFKALHLHVRTFHDAHRDVRATLRHTLACPLIQPLLPEI